ncbi:hypothetical protein SFC88_22050 [Nocardioides sp. HM23]|uniref:hypothetical protein n=1 Tax=Nocardioides bizhenqiangii TaxID=3095076 RepID=UPI002ACA16B1|nr:hypothetical protein [Nocardioides sp. HM23]MDZ5623526.1 hypothetical protein [Nocardioides sp. HM23]
MTWNQTTAAAVPPAVVTDEDREILDRWAGLIEAAPGFLAEDETERRERLQELSTATLSLTVCGDVEATTTVDLPCEVSEERPTDAGRVAGEPSPLSWLIVRVEGIDPVELGSTQLTSFSVAIPDHVGPGLYLLDDLRRRAEADEVEWWEVDDFHLSPTPYGDESTFYLDDDVIDGAWVATTGASIAFELPMASVVSEIRVAGTISWSQPSERPGALLDSDRLR